MQHAGTLALLACSDTWLPAPAPSLFTRPPHSRAAAGPQPAEKEQPTSASVINYSYYDSARRDGEPCSPPIPAFVRQSAWFGCENKRVFSTVASSRGGKWRAGGTAGCYPCKNQYLPGTRAPAGLGSMAMYLSPRPSVSPAALLRRDHARRKEACQPDSSRRGGPSAGRCS